MQLHFDHSRIAGVPFHFAKQAAHAARPHLPPHVFREALRCRRQGDRARHNWASRTCLPVFEERAALPSCSRVPVRPEDQRLCHALPV
eukprot:6398438-Pyramimonas_sp.AAC.1